VSNASTEQPPKVSIIIPCYNTAEYVRDTLESVVAQTFGSWEAIVVNDGSPDTPLLESVLEPYREQINYIVQENRGISGARNTALRVARGEYIALLDSDDYWHPDYLQSLVTVLDSDPTLDVVFPDARIFGDAHESGRTMMELMPLSGEITLERLLRQECFVYVGVVARREKLVDAGMFDEALRSSEDFDLWLRVLNSGGKIGYRRDVLAFYRRRADSLSANLARMFEHHTLVWDKAEKLLNLSEAERAALAGRRNATDAMRNLSSARAAFARGSYEEARAGVNRANQTLASLKLRMVAWALWVCPRLLWHAYRLRDLLMYRSRGAGSL
jgi:glycosyltransferase involved in cell wall biosynthesis